MAGDELVGRWLELLAGGHAQPDVDVQRRLTQGRAFYRSGRVAGLRIGPGRVAAGVQGARATPYRVEAMVAVLDDAAWADAVAVVAGEVRFAAAMLAGRHPPGLLEALRERGVELVDPAALVEARCPCGEADRPCAHVAALWEAAADRFADDPFAFFLLRGRGRQRFLADLSAARRRREGERSPRVAVDALPATTWEQAATDLDDLDVPAARPPETDAAPLRLLGDPPGWAGAQSAVETLAPLVVRAARQAEALERGRADGR